MTEQQSDYDPLLDGNVTGKLILNNILHPEYRSNDARLETYNSWPINDIVSRERLAAAGLFYTGEGDTTRCYTCGVEIKYWEKDDCPDEQHKQFSPNCCHHLLAHSKSQESGTRLIYARAESNGGGSESPLQDSVVSLDGESLRWPRPQKGTLPIEVNTENLVRKNRELKEKQTCKMCQDNQRQFVFVPCGHMIYCGRCIVEGDIRICPECDINVRGSIKTLLYPQS